MLVFATARLSEGLQATYEVRKSTIKDLRLYVGTGMVYWLIAALCYVALLVNCYPDWIIGQADNVKSTALWSAMGLTIALKGLVDALLWHTTARRIIMVDTARRTNAFSQFNADSPTDALALADGAGSYSGGTGKGAGGADTPFGVPEALREEWLDYTQLGIRTAISAAEEACGTPRASVSHRVLMLPSIREPTHDLSRMGSGRLSRQGSGRVGSQGSHERGSLASFNGAVCGSLLSANAGAEAHTGPGSIGSGIDEARATELEFEEHTCCEPGCFTRTLNRMMAGCMAFMAGGGPPFAFTEYYPADFMALRTKSGVTSRSYLDSLISGGQVCILACISPSHTFSHHAHTLSALLTTLIFCAQVWVKRTREGKGGRWRFSEGKSGSFMYFTHDRALLVKTIDASEAAVLRAHAAAYVRHLVHHPHSYLTRIYGLYSITMYNTTVHFVVMANIFASAVPRPPGMPLMDERYDLKGSWVDRNSNRPKDPHTVKKDNDLNYCFHLSSDRLQHVRQQVPPCPP